MKHSILTALLAGVVAALLLTLLQHVGTTPRILQAEQYEQTSEVSASTSHDDASHDHHHDAEAWAPEDGWQRTLSTASTNLVLACGMGLLLVAGFGFLAPTKHWHGLAWGAAGYVTFYLAPSLGLPPELPGTKAAALEHRQIWWLLTVLATALGLAIVVFADGWWKLMGAAILAVPHLIGAPQPEQHFALAPDAMIARFIIDTAWVNGVFWLALGWLSATLYRHLSGPSSSSESADAWS